MTSTCKTCVYLATNGKWCAKYGADIPPHVEAHGCCAQHWKKEQTE
ncbi:MAG: hypothetical protein AAF405_00230 [Pseudomonadota bacterium]